MSPKKIHTFIKENYTRSLNFKFNVMNLKKLTYGYFLLIVILAELSFSCSGKKAEKETTLQQASILEVSIGGMTCLGCEQTIQNNVGKLEGIKSVKASFTAGNAIIEYFPSEVDTVKIKETITGTGYTFKKFSPVSPVE
jgi:copper chaperone CopZ